jgi:alkanesulfonate monooxygenase SsuD/methylene tetrahydromethanopterin reductase-like flavin-dependent oxidoreductase (luciferase family)
VATAGHLLCAPPDSYPGRPLPTYVGPFREPFVFFAYLAAVTQRLAFRTSILILPLFPTALVAKQAAELSLLSGGRFQTRRRHQLESGGV